MGMEERDGEDLICPYCQSREGDMWEEKSEEGHRKCDECGKRFNWRRRVEVEYICNCDCKDNNEEHEYNFEDSWIENEDAPSEEFRICHCKKCSEYKVEKRLKKSLSNLEQVQK